MELISFVFLLFLFVLLVCFGLSDVVGSCFTVVFSDSMVFGLGKGFGHTVPIGVQTQRSILGFGFVLMDFIFSYSSEWCEVNGVKLTRKFKGLVKL